MAFEHEFDGLAKVGGGACLIGIFEVLHERRYGADSEVGTGSQHVEAWVMD